MYYFYNTQTRATSRGIKVGLNMGWHFPSPGEPLFNGGYVPLHLLQPTEALAISHYQSMVERRRTNPEYSRFLSLRSQLVSSEIFSRAGIRADMTSPVSTASGELVDIWLHFNSITMHVDTEPQVSPDLLPAARRIMRSTGPGYTHKDVVVRISVTRSRDGRGNYNLRNHFYVGLLSWPLLAAAAGSWHPHVGGGNELQGMCTGGTELDQTMRQTQIRTVEDVLFVALQIKTMLSSYSMRGGPYATFREIYVPEHYVINRRAAEPTLTSSQIIDLYMNCVALHLVPADGGNNLAFRTNGTPELRQNQLNERRLSDMYAQMTRSATQQSAQISPSPTAIAEATRFLPTLYPVFIHDSFLFPTVRAEDPLFSQIQPSELGSSQTGAARFADIFRTTIRRAG